MRGREFAPQPVALHTLQIPRSPCNSGSNGHSWLSSAYPFSGRRSGLFLRGAVWVGDAYVFLMSYFFVCGSVRSVSELPSQSFSEVVGQPLVPPINLHIMDPLCPEEGWVGGRLLFKHGGRWHRKITSSPRTPSLVERAHTISYSDSFELSHYSFAPLIHPTTHSPLHYCCQICPARRLEEKMPPSQTDVPLRSGTGFTPSPPIFLTVTLFQYPPNPRTR